MHDEERKEEAECEACGGSGYVCECEKGGRIIRRPKEECDYCGEKRYQGNRLHCKACGGEGKVWDVEHYAVEG